MIVYPYTGANNNKICLEIGMGKGNFIYEMAKMNPDINYIGIERYESVMYKAVLKNDADPLPNLRFVCGDASFLEAFFEKGEVDRIYLNFSKRYFSSC